eukprot:TRINITY_DN10259_c0_g1_i1.p1 TRINITY_DN10259_c0_g1~~TRINITY_DN10259_c0_g1_i1.p1  ORF type:complete len:478 (-),score=42.43 TRINITY_DN10259_c0_g1_i1:64-1329(-)
MTSFQRLMEGLFLLEGGVSPYAGGTCHQPPLLLMLLTWIPQVSPLLQFTLSVALDVVIALLLRHYAGRYAVARKMAGESWAEVGQAGSLEHLVSPDFVGLSYLLNPFVVASCLVQSLQTVHHFAICVAVCFAAAGNGGLTAGALAVVLYVFPYTPLVLILPLAHLSFTQRRVGGETHVDASKVQFLEYVRSKDTKLFEAGWLPYLVRFGIACTVLLIGMLVASAAAMRFRLEFVQASFAAVVAVQDLSPNVGIFWYLFVEVFDRYRLLFLVVFQGHLLFYSWPLYLRMGRHTPTGPWLHVSVAVGLVTLFKPYPTAADYCLMLSMLLVQAEVIHEARKLFAGLLSGMVFGLCMFPIMTAVWLTRNAGNANFAYNMTLVVTVFGCVLLGEWTRAAMAMRKRQKIFAFCRGILLAEVEKVLNR